MQGSGKAIFSGRKLRALRKAKRLTLEELSARCIQLDPQAAPSVSYLSMIESGKRVPSDEVLELLVDVFQREPALVPRRERRDCARRPTQRAGGRGRACRSSRRSCSRRSCCRRRSRNCSRRPARPGASSRTC